MRIGKFYSNKLNSHMFVYLTDVSVKMKFRKLNKFRDCHIVEINEVMVSPLSNSSTKADLSNQKQMNCMSVCGRCEGWFPQSISSQLKT